MHIRQVFTLSPELFVHLALKKTRRLVRRLIVRRRGVRFTTASPAVASCVDKVEATIRRRLPIAGVAPDAFARRYVETFGEDAICRLVERAGRIRKGEYDMLGSGPVVFDGVPDWHRDFKTGYAWCPDVYHADIRHMEPLHEANDYKVPWELSRCHHLITLSQAFFLTGDERYAETVVQHVEDWIRRNPFEFGINWVCAMDVAIRAVNWLWAYALLLDSDALDPNFRTLWLTSLVEHGRFLDANDEWGPLPNNHYVADGAGLLYLGILLNPLRGASRFLRRGLRILTSQTIEQLSPDGCNGEGTMPYHKLILETTSLPLWLARRNGLAIPSNVWRRLERAYGFLYAVMDDDGNVPNVGDADDGRLHPLSEMAPLSVRPFVNIGSCLFERPEWAGPVDGAARREWEEAFWVSGGEFVPPSRAGKRPTSKGFTDGGYYVLRNDRWRAFVDAAPIGLRDTGGHGHNDALSFELDVDREKFVVDSGTYVYKPDPSARNRFRSVRAHNTVEIDDEEPSVLCEIPRLWSVERPYRVRVHEWTASEDESLLDAEHDGYARLEPPVTHRRRFRLNRQSDTFVVEDALSGDGEHRWSWRLHVAPNVRIETDGNDALLHGRRVCVRLTCPSPIEIEPSEVSPSYGVRVSNSVLVCRGTFQRSVRFEVRFTREVHGE